jgi:hypothetical protein
MPISRDLRRAWLARVSRRGVETNECGARETPVKKNCKLWRCPHDQAASMAVTMVLTCPPVNESRCDAVLDNI